MIGFLLIFGYLLIFAIDFLILRITYTWKIRKLGLLHSYFCSPEVHGMPTVFGMESTETEFSGTLSTYTWFSAWCTVPGMQENLSIQLGVKFYTIL